MPEILLNALNKFGHGVEYEQANVLQLLFEMYRPLMFYSPQYSNDKLYIYSYESYHLVFLCFHSK